MADPSFRDPERADFSLPPDSPARALGFEPLAAATAGRKERQRPSPPIPNVPTIWIRGEKDKG